MDYQKKIRLAEEGVAFLKTGKSLTDYEHKLSDDGFYEYDIIKITASTKNIIFTEYEKEFTALFEKNELDTNRERFPLLDDAMFQSHKTLTKLNLINDAKKQVRIMLREGVHQEEIIQQIQSDYFPEIEVRDYIFKYLKKNKVQTKQGGLGSMIIGIILISGGIALSIGNTRIYYGAILAGVGMMIKGATSYFNY